MSSNARKARAVVIAINYKSARTTAEFLGSLQRIGSFPDLGVIIVDNSSGEETTTTIRDAITDLSNVELVEPVTNRGYFGGARFGFDHYLSRGDGLPDWVIVCNHDILIDDREFFSKLFREDPETVGVIAPSLQTLPGLVEQNPFMRRRPGRLRWTNLRFISSNYGIAALWDWLWRRKQEVRSWLASRGKALPPRRNVRRESIYAPHGSFFIFSRKYFEAGGFLDDNLFLYGEEIAVAEICRSLGLPVIYEPSLCVFHNEHQSTGRVLNRFTYQCQKNALDYITSRYLSGSPELERPCQPGLS